MQSPWILGLTGGIGSGKSAVAAHFAALGVPVIDDDHIARQLVEPGQPALTRIAEHFGQDILQADGGLDRGALRERIFANPQERRWLESLLHPLVREESLKRLAQANYPYAILMSPLLLETGQSRQVRRVLVVDAPQALQIQRITARDGIDSDQAQAIIKAQLPRDERLRQADDVLLNDQDLASLKKEVERLHHLYLGLSGH